MEAGHVQGKARVQGCHCRPSVATPTRKLLQIAVALLAGFFLVVQPAGANHIPYGQGDVFAGVGNGKINHYGPTGALKEVLDTTTGVTDPPGDETGMCFDPAGNLYATNYSAFDMAKFNSQGGLIAHPFGPFFDFAPESCAVDAPGQNLYVVVNGGASQLRKLDLAGNLRSAFSPATGPSDLSSLDLAKDQCTIDYVTEGTLVKRFNVCTNTQLTDFASGLPGPCYGLRIRSNGEVLVACDRELVRLNTGGGIVQHYNPGNERDFFTITLDPDGVSFWAAGYTSGHIYKVDIATGSVGTNYVAAPTGNGLAGLAAYGDGPALPGYPRPKGATPTKVALVVAYNRCTAPNRQHGEPLAYGSCSPPQPASNQVTVGTPDANGSATNFLGSVLYQIQATAPPDVKIDTSVTDVRKKSDLSDYTGELQTTSSLRITDKYNSAEPATQPFNDPATTTDSPFSVTVPCAGTSSSTVGSTCSLVTTANAVAPGAVLDSMRTIWQLGQVQVFDGGPDGLASTAAGNTLFLDQGVFVP
jgi:hypothetical protein